MSAKALIARLEAKPGRRDEVVELITKVFGEVGAQRGTLAFNAHPEGDNTLWVYELYADDQAWAEHRSGEMFNAVQPSLAELFSEPPDVHVLETVLHHGRAHEKDR